MKWPAVVLGRCARPECNARVRMIDRSRLAVSKSDAYGGSVKDPPLGMVKSHRTERGRSSSSTLVGAKVHTMSSQAESRRNQPRSVLPRRTGRTALVVRAAMRVFIAAAAEAADCRVAARQRRARARKSA